MTHYYRIQISEAELTEWLSLNEIDDYEILEINPEWVSTSQGVYCNVNFIKPLSDDQAVHFKIKFPKHFKFKNPYLKSEPM